MTGHAPYLMPDGRSLQSYLRAEREKELLRKKKAAEVRSKDEQFKLLVAAKATASERDLAELNLIEAAGARRRRRYLNEKVLRDMAGPLSALDMESQFKPAPFGNPAKPSPLVQVMAPENAALWDNFRNIDPEKEARVIQKWADHQTEQRALLDQQRGPGRHSAAAEALQRWARIGKNARAALKQANPTSVLSLELQVQGFAEEAQPHEQLAMPIEDAFGRLLVHGLAEYYGLLSASKTVDGQPCVVVYFRRARREQEPPAPAPGGKSPAASPSPSPQRSRPIPTSPSPADALGMCDITCTDVLLAMAEVGQLGLSPAQLQHYVDTHIHGGTSSSAPVPPISSRAVDGGWLLV